MTASAARLAAAAAFAAFATSAAVAAEVARASSWGFDPADSTEFLQAAISSGVRRLVVDKMPSPWVVRPLRGVSNQEIVFEPGVVVEAKKGEFRGRDDCLFWYEDCTNVSLVCHSGDAVLKMRRADYLAPPYAPAEWRHCLSFLSCSGVRIEGLSLRESGGDGIYIGQRRGGGLCRDFIVRNVVCDSNARQGMSVIAVENLLVEGSSFVRTKGVSPQAGVDIEPNLPNQRVSNVVLRNCVMEDNASEGVVISLSHFRRKTQPVSIRLENCLMRGNTFGFNVTERSPRGDAPTGEIVLDGCRIENSRWNGVNFRQKVAGSVRLLLKDCAISGCCTDIPKAPDVRFDSRRRSDPPPDDIRFENLKIVQGVDRSPFGFVWAGWCDESVTNITGTATVTGPSGTRRVVMDDAWRSALFPVKPPWRRHVPPRIDASGVTDAFPGKFLEVAPLTLRDRADYCFYASSARCVRFEGESVVFRTTRTEDPWISVSSMDGMWSSEVPFPPKGGGAFSVDVPSPGFYRMSACPSRVRQRFAWGFRLTGADVPVAVLLSSDTDQCVNKSVGEVFLRVAPDEEFEFHPAGDGHSERVGVVLTSPEGKEAFSSPDVGDDEHVRASGEGVWTIRFSPPSNGVFEDFRFDLTGVPALVFLRKDRTW